MSTPGTTEAPTAVGGAPITRRPAPDEYSPYYERYVARVPAGDLRAILERQIGDTQRLLATIPESRGEHRYAPGKWSIKDVVGHLGDTERIMCYRALRVARGDETPLPAFDENAYVPAANFGRRTLRDLAEEFAAVRGATLALFRHLDDEALDRRGTASDKTISARALGYIIAGHELHHLELLRTRYLAPSRDAAAGAASRTGAADGPEESHP
jgi:hypothetical protein